MFVQDKIVKVIPEPAPEFDTIGYAGCAAAWHLQGNQGKAGICEVLVDYANQDYDNSLTREIVLNDDNDKKTYSLFFLDYLITKKVKFQSADLKINGAGPWDFATLEVLYLANENPETWIMARRFVNKFFFSTDFEDQDAPLLPYSKTMEPGKFIVRIIYHKEQSNNNDVKFRVNYMAHEVAENGGA